MASRDSIRRTLELIETKLAARDTQDDEQALRSLTERLERYFAQCAQYDAMAVDEKIACKRGQLEELKATQFAEYNKFMATLRVRLLEIDIEELQGADAESVERMRREATEFFRWRGRPPKADPGIARPPRTELLDEPYAPARIRAGKLVDKFADYRERFEYS
jgi:hypothetical protein